MRVSPLDVTFDVMDSPEFRENMHLTDQNKIDKCVDVATKGVGQLRAYTGAQCHV